MNRHVLPVFFSNLITIVVVGLLSTACKNEDTPSAQSTPEQRPSSEQAPASEMIAAEQLSSPPSQAAINENPSKGSSAAESSVPDSSKIRATKAPEIVKEPASIAMDEGFSPPKIGDKIYGWHNLPDGACGEYWIKGPNGKVSKISICRDEH